MFSDLVTQNQLLQVCRANNRVDRGCSVKFLFLLGRRLFSTIVLVDSPKTISRLDRIRVHRRRVYYVYSHRINKTARYKTCNVMKYGNRRMKIIWSDRLAVFFFPPYRSYNLIFSRAVFRKIKFVLACLPGYSSGATRARDHREKNEVGTRDESKR